MSHDFTGTRRTARSAFAAFMAMADGHRLWCCVSLLGIGTILLIAAAGCGQKPSGAQQSHAAFLGDAACAGCHPQEFSQHRASHHAVTMRLVDAASMGRDLPAPGPIQGTEFAVYRSGAGVALGLKESAVGAVPMQYALGSDRFAFTYIDIVNDRTLQEVHESYYHPIHGWLPTPGQEMVEASALARPYDEEASRACLSCHTTTLPDNKLTPEPRFFGVGCESCHGPGQRHVEAVRAGEMSDLHIAKLGALSAARLNEMCGRCHRTAKDVSDNEADLTQRFEPYGLMKSRCFIESGGTLSCLTCHNPHTDASTDQKSYEKVCLSCHMPQSSYGPQNPEHKSCPVNPSSGCIPCHMPRRRLTASLPIIMSDHYIRVFDSSSNSN